MSDGVVDRNEHHGAHWNLQTEFKLQSKYHERTQQTVEYE